VTSFGKAIDSGYIRTNGNTIETTSLNHPAFPKAVYQASQFAKPNPGIRGGGGLFVDVEKGYNTPGYVQNLHVPYEDVWKLLDNPSKYYPVKK
jgi:hypothetical protein